jgi:RecA-family ATPase
MPKLQVIPKRGVTSVGELLDETFPEENHIIGSGLLTNMGMLVIGGPPKTYKSFICNSIAYHLVTATPLFGADRAVRGVEREFTFPIKSSHKVLLLEQEIGRQNIQGRFQQLVAKVDPASRILVREKVFINSKDHEMNLDTERGRVYIARIVEKVKPGVVCFDPLMEFHNSDENSASEMAKVLHGIDWLQERFPFSSILVHHLSKPTRDNPRKGPDMLRGSSVLHGKGDSFMLLTPNQKEQGVVHVDFTIRQGRPIDGMTIAIDFDTLHAKFQHWDRSNQDRKSVRSRFAIDD